MVSLTMGGKSADAEEKALIQQIASRIGALPGVRDVRVEVVGPAESDAEDGPLWTPLQAELLEEGVTPEMDPLTASDLGLGLASAMAAGYEVEGPLSFGGPGGPRPSEDDDGSYCGATPVLQWEVNPQDPSLESGEADLELHGWEYSIWWQSHPRGLVYAAIRAMGQDTPDPQGKARENPVGRAVAVNLVYDRDRGAVLAIYGTARDFRPFVEAFACAYGVEGACAEAGPSQEGTPRK